jgi:14-3-3 protein epsilon
VVLRLALVAPALAAGVQGAVLAPLARRRRNAATHCFGVAAAAISGASSTLLNRIQRSGEEAAQVDVAAGRGVDGTRGEATGDDDDGPRCPVPNRGKQVFLAKVAKQAERYNEMADHLELAGKSGSELSVEEHRLLSVAYQNAVGKLCDAALGLLDQYLIPMASNGESEVFYLRMKADYHRYIAEVTTGDAKAVAASSAEAAYVAAAAVAVKESEHEPMVQVEEIVHGEQVYLAKLAEQAECYDEMAYRMELVCKSGKELSVEERNMLSVAYKNAVGSRRAAWRSITTVELEEESKGNEVYAAWAREYRTNVDSEVQKICNTVLGLLDQCLIPNASDGESKAFYLKMKADYHRHIAEFTAGEAKVEAACCAEAAFAEAVAVAERFLAITHPIRLSLAWPYSAFLHEVQSKPKEACQLAYTAIEAATAEIDNVQEDFRKDYTLIMQILCDNLASWTAGTVVEL